MAVSPFQDCTAVDCFNIFEVIVDSIQVLAVSTRACRVNSLLGRPHRHVVSRLFVLALSSIELVPSSCPARANPTRLPGTESWCRTASIPRIHAVTSWSIRHRTEVPANMAGRLDTPIIRGLAIGAKTDFPSSCLLLPPLAARILWLHSATTPHFARKQDCLSTSCIFPRGASTLGRESWFIGCAAEDGLCNARMEAGCGCFALGENDD